MHSARSLSRTRRSKYPRHGGRIASEAGPSSPGSSPGGLRLRCSLLRHSAIPRCWSCASSSVLERLGTWLQRGGACIFALDSIAGTRHCAGSILRRRPSFRRAYAWRCALDGDLSLSWRQIFLCCGSVGFVWATFWYRWFRDEPADHPSVSREERDMILRERNLPALTRAIDAGSFAAVFKHPSSWFLCLMYVANTVRFLFPDYLGCPLISPMIRGTSQKPRARALRRAFRLCSVYWRIFSGVSPTDWITKRFGTRIGRYWLGFTGYASRRS